MYLDTRFELDVNVDADKDGAAMVYVDGGITSNLAPPPGQLDQKSSWDSRIRRNPALLNEAWYFDFLVDVPDAPLSSYLGYVSYDVFQLRIYTDRYELWNTQSGLWLGTHWMFTGTAGRHNIGIRAGVNGGVWVDGTQLTLPGLILTNNTPVNAGFGTHGIGGDPGLVLLENLNYIRSYNRGMQEGIPTLGTPVVTITNFDEDEPITTHTPFYNGSSVQELIATNTPDHGTTDRNTEGVMVQEVCLANGRGITAQVVRPSIDMVSYLEDSSRLSLEGRVPGVAIGIHADAVGALTPFVNLQPDPNTIPYPGNEWPVYGAPTPSFDNEGLYALAGTPLTNGAGGTDYMDATTGLMTTTEGGQVEDRTTSVEHNQTAPEVSAPEADDAPLANPTPIDIPPPERVGGNPGRGWLSNAWLKRFLWLQAWIKTLRVSDSWGIDEIKVMLSRILPYLREIEELFGEDLHGDDWSTIFGIWSEGQEYVKALEARIRDIEGYYQDNKVRSKDPSRETVSTGGYPKGTLARAGFDDEQREKSNAAKNRPRTKPDNFWNPIDLDDRDKASLGLIKEKWTAAGLNSKIDRVTVASEADQLATAIVHIVAKKRQLYAETCKDWSGSIGNQTERGATCGDWAPGIRDKLAEWGGSHRLSTPWWISRKVWSGVGRFGLGQHEWVEVTFGGVTVVVDPWGTRYIEDDVQWPGPQTWLGLNAPIPGPGGSFKTEITYPQYP